MIKTINLKDAAKLAGLGIFEMRDAVNQNGLLPGPKAFSVGSTKLDRDRFYAWLDDHNSRVAEAQAEEKEMRYAEWIAENGEFLERFLADHAEN